ncbi:universal stress protein [bacterium SCSIO 12741]|nr:universal stress protein [bacterium SCSIO 12741]
MKVLMLTKFSETDSYVNQFAERIHEKEPLEVELLHVVSSYSEVPLKDDGSITDYCSDIDLSQLYAQQAKAREKSQAYSKSPVIKKVSVLIGQLDKIVAYKLRNENFDALFMGAHPTKFYEDFFINTTLERMIKSVDIPVLSLKCDRSGDHTIERIGLFDDFEEDHSKNVRQVRIMADAFGAEVHLYKIMHGSGGADAETYRKRMEKFAQDNELKRVVLHVLNESGSDESKLTQHLLEDNLQMIVVSELHRDSLSWIYPKDLKTAVANHVFAPLFIY